MVADTDWDDVSDDNAGVSVADVDTVNTGMDTMFPAADGDDVIATTAGVGGADVDVNVNGSGEDEVGDGADVDVDDLDVGVREDE